MARNRIRSANTLQARQIWKLVAGLFVVTLFGLAYVFMQVRSIRAADEIKKLEVAFDDLSRKNQGLEVRVSHLKSPAALQRKVSGLNLGMVDISASNLTVVIAPMPVGGRLGDAAYASRKEDRP